LRSEAFAEAPAHSGMLDGQPFEWLADADARLGPCLEVIVDGKYYWTPIGNVRSLRLEPPADLRDLIWARGAITWVNGGEVPALLPVRYPGTESAAATDLHRLSRQTDWVPQGGDTYFGVGQRMLGTDHGEYSFLDVRQLSIGPPGGPT
jgi:type VI secretion system protein ImpE